MATFRAGFGQVAGGLDRSGEGDAVSVEGDLTIKGVTRRVSAAGTWLEIDADVTGAPRIGIELNTTIDRTAHGLNWNAPLPKGGFALANDVALSVHLEFVLLEGEVLRSIPPYDEDERLAAPLPPAESPLRGKDVAVVGASTGMFGAVWAQAELRKVLAATGGGSGQLAPSARRASSWDTR